MNWRGLILGYFFFVGVRIKILTFLSYRNSY